MPNNWYWLLISAAAAAAAAHAAPPARVEISYTIARNGSPVAEVVHRMQHNGRIYRLTETWKGKGIYALRGSATRSSRGIVSPEGLKPVEFLDERTGRNTARAQFDWEAKKLTMQYRGDPRNEPLPARAHDRLAFLFDFAFAPPRPGGEIVFDLMDGRGQSRHVYSVNGRERLKVPAGEFDAIRMEKRTSDELAQIWLAAGLSHLPVRLLVVHKDGTRYDQVATKIATE